MLENTGQKTGNTEPKHSPDKAINAKHSKTKLPWFSRLLWHSAWKQGGLILRVQTLEMLAEWWRSSVRYWGTRPCDVKSPIRQCHHLELVRLYPRTVDSDLAELSHWTGAYIWIISYRMSSNPYMEPVICLKLILVCKMWAVFYLYSHAS